MYGKLFSGQILPGPLEELSAPHLQDQLVGHIEYGHLRKRANGKIKDLEIEKS